MGKEKKRDWKVKEMNKRKDKRDKWINGDENISTKKIWKREDCEKKEKEQRVKGKRKDECKKWERNTNVQIER